jgi:hypothetical protein
MTTHLPAGGSAGHRDEPMNVSEGPRTAPESAHLTLASPDTRKSRLATAVQQEVSRGGRVESQSDYSAVIRYGKPVNNVLHLILCLVTFGLWVIVWIISAIAAANNNKAISLLVDEYGQVLRQEL